MSYYAPKPRSRTQLDGRKPTIEHPGIGDYAGSLNDLTEEAFVLRATTVEP